jgi:hypothetical protein
LPEGRSGDGVNGHSNRFEGVPTVGGHCGIEHNVMQSLERHVVAYAEQMIDRALTLICTGFKRDEKIG